ncbi:hypothetical protein CGC21_31035 [Leishmania donovani]|uniref:Selenoprotein F/M domain-containing protein n=1 Tax=Leishmania donovani TaxID=5661 RepID=A0A504XIJ3_LEIDO|nr:hypothetical protein CGC21_31035 [Leishmania donovani]
MRVTKFVLLCLAAALLSVVIALPSMPAPETVADCLGLGFEKDVVSCRLCAKLLLVTQNDELRKECESCCTADKGGAADDVTYVSARIELRGIARATAPSEINSLAIFKRTRRLEPYFKYISFVEKSSMMFPQVVLVGSDPKDDLTMHITGWSAEALHDLFRKKIRVN